MLGYHAPLQIVVPFLRNRHFSVYVVNFKHHRVDILDPNPWNLIGDGWKETHKGTVKYGNSKGQWCKIMMKRLNEAIQAARPDSGIPKFGNYKCEMLDGIHKQKIGSNDYGFYCMWYMEYYDASTAKVLWPYSVCVLCIVRATSRWHLYSLLKQISIQSYTVTIGVFVFMWFFTLWFVGLFRADMGWRAPVHHLPWGQRPKRAPRRNRAAPPSLLIYVAPF